jgi:hypothetical protein
MMVDLVRHDTTPAGDGRWKACNEINVCDGCGALSPSFWWKDDRGFSWEEDLLCPSCMDRTARMQRHPCPLFSEL